MNATSQDEIERLKKDLEGVEALISVDLLGGGESNEDLLRKKKELSEKIAKLQAD